jgi:threonine dehydratase
LGAPVVSEVTLRLAQQYLESVTVVSDAEAFGSLRFLLERSKMLTEPAASCTLAAAERLRDHFGPDRHVVLFLCGGNLGVDDLCSFLSRFPESELR